MKREVQVSVVQFATEWLSPERNIERMAALADAEARQGAALVVFPELANVGYITPAMPGAPLDCEDLTLAEFAVRYLRAAEPVPGPTTEALAAVARRHGAYVVVGIAQRHPQVPGTLYNSGVLIGPTGVIGVHHKMHLPLEEKLYFYAGNTAEVWRTDLGNIGVVVCYDGRFPELPRILALRGAEIICNIWAISAGVGSVTPADDTLAHRAYTRAQENGVFYICANRAGFQGKTRFIGQSVVAAPNGTLIARSETSEEDVIRAPLREDDLLQYRGLLNIFRDRRPEMYGLISKPLSEPYRPEARGAAPPELSAGAQAGPA